MKFTDLEFNEHQESWVKVDKYHLKIMKSDYKDIYHLRSWVEHATIRLDFNFNSNNWDQVYLAIVTILTSLKEVK